MRANAINAISRLKTAMPTAMPVLFLHAVRPSENDQWLLLRLACAAVAQHIGRYYRRPPPIVQTVITSVFRCAAALCALPNLLFYDRNASPACSVAECLVGRRAPLIPTRSGVLVD